jgi:hypothetical protein
MIKKGHVELISSATKWWQCTVRIFRPEFALERAITSHTCSLEALCMRVTNGIPLGCPLFLPVHIVNCVQTLQAQSI